MTADSPASGLPQEAVDAAARALSVSQQWVTVTGTHPAEAPARVALTAALPLLREQWEAETTWTAREAPYPASFVNRLREDLAAERAKVAALQQEANDWHDGMVKAQYERDMLQQAVDKVRALHKMVSIGDITQCVECSDEYPVDPCPTVALLPDVQADDRGTCACQTPFFTHGSDGTWCNACRQPYVSRVTAEEIAAAVNLLRVWPSGMTEEVYGTLGDPPCPGCGKRPCVCTVVLG